MRDTLTAYDAAYDAAYVVLAETLGAVVICTDAKLARASGRFADVEVLT